MDSSGWHRSLSRLGWAVALLMLVPHPGPGGASAPHALTQRQVVEAPPDLTLTPYTVGFDRPVDIAATGSAGDLRLFVVEQAGGIRLIQADASVNPQPFLDIKPRVGASGSEQGLLGLAFDPGYAQNGYFYINYTDRQGDTVIARYAVDPANPDRADPASEFVILKVDQPNSNHNAGDLAFGPDGYLYIPLGDGGGRDDPANRAQNLSELLGKILRLEVSDPTGQPPPRPHQLYLPLVTGPGVPYRIPPDNPYLLDGDPTTRPEIWSSGLRNPWRISFDRATGDLFIGDVGQNAWEEVDYQPAGQPGAVNYGWRCYEGNHPAFHFNPQTCTAAYAAPIFEYDHSLGHAITGGFVYRGDRVPAWDGHYFLADFSTGRFWRLYQSRPGTWQITNLGQPSPGINPSTFGENSAGELFVADYSRGTIYRLDRASP